MRAFNFYQKPTQIVAQIILYYHVKKQSFVAFLIDHVVSISEYAWEKH